MVKVLSLFVLLLIFAIANGFGASDIHLRSVSIDLKDKTKLQRGARMYMNYCSGCHSLKYMRYQKMAKDLGLITFDGDVDDDLLYNNLIFTSAKKHDPIDIAMPPVDSREWFGVVPPDLSLTTRRRGANWVYTYLQSFYEDNSRPFGANNLLLPGVAMPNVLRPLEGRLIALNGGEKGPLHTVMIESGRMTQHEFEQSIEDLVNFLVYVAEPAQLIRYKIGMWVLLYLCIFLVAIYKLKKIYWKRIL